MQNDTERPRTRSREEVLRDIDAGKKIKTVRWESGVPWDGAEVHRTSNGYLRTDANDVDEDNLGELPSF